MNSNDNKNGQNTNPNARQAIKLTQGSKIKSGATVEKIEKMEGNKFKIVYDKGMIYEG